MYGKGKKMMKIQKSGKVDLNSKHGRQIQKDLSNLKKQENQEQANDLMEVDNLSDERMTITQTECKVQAIDSRKGLVIGGNTWNGIKTKEVILPLSIIPEGTEVSAEIILSGMSKFSKVFVPATTHHPGTFKQMGDVGQMFTNIKLESGNKSVLKSGLTKRGDDFVLVFGKLNDNGIDVIFDPFTYFMALSLLEIDVLDAILVNTNFGQGLDLDQIIANTGADGFKMNVRTLSAYAKQFFDILVDRMQADLMPKPKRDRVLTFGNTSSEEKIVALLECHSSDESEILVPAFLRNMPIFSISYFPINLAEVIPFTKPPTFNMYDQESGKVISQMTPPMIAVSSEYKGTLVYSEDLNGYILSEELTSALDEWKCEYSPKLGTLASRNVIKVKNQGPINVTCLLVKRLDVADLEHYLVIKPLSLKYTGNGEIYDIIDITIPCNQGCIMFGQGYCYQAYRINASGKVFGVFDGYAKVFMFDKLFDALSSKPVILCDDYSQFAESKLFNRLSKEDATKVLLHRVYKSQDNCTIELMKNNIVTFLSYINSHLFFLPDLQKWQFINYIMPQIIGLNRKMVLRQENPSITNFTFRFPNSFKGQRKNSYSCKLHEMVDQLSFTCENCISGIYRFIKSHQFELDGMGSSFWSHFGDLSTAALNVIELSKGVGFATRNQSCHKCNRCDKKYISVKLAMICNILHKDEEVKDKSKEVINIKKEQKEEEIETKNIQEPTATDVVEPVSELKEEKKIEELKTETNENSNHDEGPVETENVETLQNSQKEETVQEGHVEISELQKPELIKDNEEFAGIMDKFLSEIRTFNKTSLTFFGHEKTNYYYYISESLNRITGKLDDYTNQLTEEAVVRRKKVYAELFPTIDILDRIVNQPITVDGEIITPISQSEITLDQNGKQRNGKYLMVSETELLVYVEGAFRLIDTEKKEWVNMIITMNYQDLLTPEFTTTEKFKDQLFTMMVLNNTLTFKEEEVEEILNRMKFSYKNFLAIRKN